jgi:EAL domain-containing protein (putative c-di-GMP-specific phosphodiesterase class I)
VSEILTLPPLATAEETDTDGPPFILRSTPDAIERLLALARTQLGMEVAIVSEFTEHEQVLRHQEGNPEEFGLEIGASTRLTDTYCWRVVNGQLPQVIADAKSDVRLRDLEVTWEADIGSYIGVPIRLSNGLIYGSVFCLSHSANPSLRSRDAELMTTLSALIGQDIEAAMAARVERLQRIERIRGVLERGGLGVVFRPVFDLRSLVIVGYETVPRFEKGGSPERWLAEATEIGLGPDLERAAKQVALAHLGDLPANAYVWVSLSRTAVGISKVLDMLAAVPGDRIIVALAVEELDAEDRIEQAVHDLRARDLRLAIDHVNSQATALAHIVSLQPDVIRLDGGEVTEIEADRTQRDAVSFLVQLGSQLGAVIVADGIETRSTVRVLRDLGIPYGQGYALAPPLNPEDVRYEQP